MEQKRVKSMFYKFFFVNLFCCICFIFFFGFWFILCFSLFLVVVVILNLLIALMGDIYAQVQANATAESTFGIAKLIVEYEGLMSYSYKKKNREKFFPRWLYILEKIPEEDDLDDFKRMEQKMVGMKTEMAEMKAEMKESMNQLLALLRDK